MTNMRARRAVGTVLVTAIMVTGLGLGAANAAAPTVSASPAAVVQVATTGSAPVARLADVAADVRTADVQPAPQREMFPWFETMFSWIREIPNLTADTAYAYLVSYGLSPEVARTIVGWLAIFL